MRTLLREYADAIGVDLSFQDFDSEVADPLGFYELVLLASDGDGCVGLRRIDEQTCEMKRLYVRPEFRGRRVGRLLAERVLAEARAIGYARLRLDTLPSMKEAIPLYRSLGFAEIAPYYANPVPGALFMELALT